MAPATPAITGTFPLPTNTHTHTLPPFCGRSHRADWLNLRRPTWRRSGELFSQSGFNSIPPSVMSPFPSLHFHNGVGWGWLLITTTVLPFLQPAFLHQRQRRRRRRQNRLLELPAKVKTSSFKVIFLSLTFSKRGAWGWW